MPTRTVTLSLFAVTMIFLFAACEQASDPVPDTPVPTTMVAAALDQLGTADRNTINYNAAYLALRDMHEDSLTRVSTVEITPALLEFYTNALAHVALASGVPATDSVRSIRTFPRPEAFSLILYVENAAPWMNAWAQGILSTGYDTLDQMIQRHGPGLYNIYQTSWGYASVELRAARARNIVALAPQFSGLTHIRASWPNSVAGDGPDVFAERDEEGVTLLYRAAWGDCPSGCISEHIWTFRVRNDGQVTLISITGPNLP